jgi:hypothetical protein
VPFEVKTFPAVPAEVTPVPPRATGSVPALIVDASTAPPRVKLPLEVTVPLKVIPLTLPVPLTEVTEPPAEVEVIVIEPAPLVIAIPDPAVNVAFVNVLPVVLPINN